jgi:RimJ/RimL family protein N-acetyltransferase
MFIRTRNLLLRPYWPQDATQLAHALNDLDVVQYLASAPYPYRQADADYFIERSLSQPLPQPDFAMIAIALPDQPLVGGIGILHQSGTAPELGYWIAQDFWGQGFATEAAAAVLELAFLAYGHAQVEASHMIDNQKSAHLLEQKLGFTETGFSDLWCEARQAMVPVRKLVLSRTKWHSRWANTARSAEMLAA